jgi:hypothetical protein
MDKSLQQTTRMSVSSTDSLEKMSEQEHPQKSPPDDAPLGTTGAGSLAQPAEKDKPSPSTSTPEYPPQGKRIVIVISLYLALFLNTLVRPIDFYPGMA